MTDVEKSYNKISEYLTSFIVRKPNESVFSPPARKSVCKGLESGGSPSSGSPVHKNQKHSQRLSTGKKTTQPKNEQEFKKRVSSYKFGLWTSVGLSPLLCASYGWQVIEKDLLQCVTCKAVVCTSLPLPSDTQAYAKFLHLLKDRLKCGHKEWCGWSYNPCPPEFLHPPLEITVHYIENLIEDALKLCSMGTNLPYIDIEELLQKLSLERNQISLFGSQKDPTKIQLTATVLVLTGWTLDAKEKLRCKICLRNIRPLNFLPLKEEENFLSAEDKYLSNQELKREKEARRKERERKLKTREELKKAQLEAKREAEEAEKKAKEQAEKVQQVLDKVSRLKDVDSLSDSEESDENDEGLGEEEENSLLAEDIDQNEEERVNSKSADTKSSEKMNISNDPNDEPCENTGAVNEIKTSEERESKQKNKLLPGSPNGNGKLKSDAEKSEIDDTGDSTNAKKREEVGQKEQEEQTTFFKKLQDNEIASTSEEEKVRSENEDTSSSADDLWLEAVGGYAQGEEDQSLAVDEGEESSKHAESDSSLDSFENTLKRRRSSEDASPHTDLDNINPAKVAKYDDKEVEMMLKLFETSETSDEGKDNDAKEDEDGSDLESSESEADDLLNEEDARFTKMNDSLFKPLEQHHHWCGWVTDYTSLHLEEAVRHIPGYKILPDQLKEILPQLTSSSLATSEKYAHNVEGLRAVRGILDSWAVPEIMEAQDADS